MHRDKCPNIFAREMKRCEKYVRTYVQFRKQEIEFYGLVTGWWLPLAAGARVFTTGPTFVASLVFVAIFPSQLDLIHFITRFWNCPGVFRKKEGASVFLFRSCFLHLSCWKIWLIKFQM